MEESVETREGLVLAGRYKLAESIGSGGMGQVWRADDELLNRTVAIKELTAALYVTAADRAVLHARTQKEARAAARISHPAVVTVHDVLDHGGRPWIVMQYVDGPSLADAVAAGPVVVKEAARIGLQVLEALRAAHAAGVLHRDVKPGNVLLARDGRVLLTDFGIAAIEGDSAITRTGEIVGSIDYLAPERVRGHDPGPASDLWALGATLHTAVEGTSPFRRTSAVATMQAVVTDDPPAPVRAGLLTPVIAALLHKDPEARPDAAETERMLRAVLDGREPEAPTSPVSEAERRQAAGPVASASHTPPPVARHPQHQQAPAPYPSPYAHTPPNAYQQVTGPRTINPPAGNGRWRAVLVAVVAAALIGGGVGYYALQQTDDKNDPGTSAGANPDPSGSSANDGANDGADDGADQDANGGSGSGDESDPSGTGPASVPDGWKQVEDPAGFSVLVPEDWERQVNGDQIDYTPDDGVHFLRIAVDTSPDFQDPYHHMKDMEKNVDGLPGYQRISLGPNTFRGQTKAALWEFTWTETDEKEVYVGPRRAIDQMFFSADGSTEYALYMSGPARDWSRAQFDTMLGGWRAGSAGD
ncbi:serine/threonine protein kinase [Streptomyces sp. IB2014 016-6]|nr:serine/threonine protein kinase [Streptomyces sp. IB2014 016-6]